MLFLTTCHPKNDGQTERVNRTLRVLLQAIFLRILSLEECLSLVEFAYDRIIHSTTHFSRFEVVYGFNPFMPLVLLSYSF